MAEGVPSPPVGGNYAERGAQNINGRTVGFVAIQTTFDKDTGDVNGEPIVLARFGELPKELQAEE